jgi:protein-S-isoprenylcysteine O-methyltransferase Ste14
MPPEKSAHAANPSVPPPLLFVLFFLATFLLNALLPLQLLPLAWIGWRPIPATLLTLGGLGIFTAAALALRKARTPLSPYKPTQKLLTTGPYLRTRNPIYLAFAWLYLGSAFWIASLWPVLFFPVLIYGMNRFVIAPEEAHLEQRFGGAYRDYKARTRRWM